MNHAFVTMTDDEIAELIGKNNFEQDKSESQKLIRKKILSNDEKSHEVIVIKKPFHFDY